MKVAPFLLLGLLLSTTLLFVAASANASTSPPNYFMEFSNSYATAIVNVPSIGNITTMTISGIHQDKSSTSDNYNVLSVALSSNLQTEFAASVAVASISTNYDAEDISWRKALGNGTSVYTEINGNVTINNLFRVTTSELSVQKIGKRVTIDFNPLNPIVITLPPSQFPQGDFPATWIVPAFHMDLDVNGSLTLGNSTVSNPSGWIEYNEYADAPANCTSSCPAWGNYQTSGTGSIRQFNMHRGQAPGNPTIPADPLKTIELANLGVAVFEIPTTGGINRFKVAAIHAVQWTLGPSDMLLLTLSAAGFSGSALANVMTNPAPEALAFYRTVHNGTSRYTQANGTVLINNIFQVSANELKVQRNGNNMTVDFNPTTPVVITLPDQFPRENFATWTVPAFHMEVNLTSLVPTLSPFYGATTSYPSGWKEIENGVLAGSTSARCSIPSMNLTTTGTGIMLVPYHAVVFQSQDYIPEGLTIGVIMLLSSIAALVCTIYFRKPSRIAK